MRVSLTDKNASGNYLYHMHQRQEFCAYVCVFLYGSHRKQRLLSRRALTGWVL
jgi:hypothetical protein